MYALPTAPLSAGGVLDAAYRLFRASFESVLVLSIIATAIAYLPLVGIAYSGAAEDPLALISLAFNPWFLAACLALTLICILFYAAMLVRMEAFARDESMSSGAAAAIALRAFPRVLAASLLFIVAVSLGLVALLIPGLILMQSLMFYLPAIVLDDRGAIDSLGYSHQLVWGLWWRTAAIWGFGLLISMVAVYLGAAIGIVVAFLPFDLRAISVLEIALQALVTVLITPFMVALWLEIYRDLKLRKVAVAHGGPFDARLEDGWRDPSDSDSRAR
jgi:hypothetical protein